MISEDDAKTLIDRHLSSIGWDITDFNTVRKNWSISRLFPSVSIPTDEGRKRPDYTIILDGQPVALIEAKRPGKDLLGALEEAKIKAEIIKRYAKVDIALIFSSDGKAWLRKNLKARTLPEKINEFVSSEELKEIVNPESEKLNPKYGLRDYQRIASSQVISSVLSGRDKMYIHMATASGKTIVACAFIAKLFSMGKIKRVLFMVDRDPLAEQAVRKFKDAVGEHYEIKRLSLDSGDRFADVLVSTVQMLATGDKYSLYSPDFFDLIILDECHRSYFGEWHGVVEHFRKNDKKAIILGMTATPSDKETVNTDRYFGPPVFRYTYRQGVWDGRLADTVYYKFKTNLDVYGVHELGFDFDPEDLGRAVDVNQRNELIAEKYFEVIDFKSTKELKKALVFAASIQHANNLRYAFIRKYNEQMGRPVDDAEAEKFIVSIHTGIPGAKDLINDFQRIKGPVQIAVSIDMLSTGIDAPDIEVLVMARPTKSKVLYAQMKGRGTRKCEETGKEKFSLIDFVDTWTFEEEIITNEQLEEEEEKQWEAYEPEETRVPITEAEEPREKRAKYETGREVKKREMVILDVPVWLEYSEVIKPEMLHGIGKQIELQLKSAQDRKNVCSRFEQAVLSWKYFRGDENVSESYLTSMGFDLQVLRSMYGEPKAELNDFVQVALGKKRFPTLEERRREAIKRKVVDEGYSEDAADFILILWDFKRRNPGMTTEQFFKSELVRRKGGVGKIKQIFGDIKKFWEVYEEVKS
ncbi:MAG: DEAD/DEAH box helicase family protein [Methanophagales archaeon]|nr:DEAD/DEAH box helicase family protein [Methanophagales archaeon]